MSDAPQHVGEGGSPDVAAKLPKLGGMRGEFSWEEGWDRAFTREEAEAFWEGR
jgi:hypothetical protein